MPDEFSAPAGTANAFKANFDPVNPYRKRFFQTLMVKMQALGLNAGHLAAGGAVKMPVIGLAAGGCQAVTKGAVSGTDALQDVFCDVAIQNSVKGDLVESMPGTNPFQNLTGT